MTTPDRAKKNEEFGRLLSGAINSIATYEGKTAPAVEADLGQQIGLAGATVQRYKRGHLPPDPRTVQLLAEAAVRRGFLNRRWLSRFLHAAAYPSPDVLLNALCPAAAAEAPAGRPLHNLPPPSYAQFVMRPSPFAEVMDALGQRTAAVVIASLGGMGKTSLAREVAARCLEPGAEPGGFDAAIWISDAERPGFTTLSAALDEIARTLGHDGLVERSEDDKRRSVEHLLRNQRALVIVDNFETVTDAALLRWLLKLPEPSKAILTTREYRREFRHGAWPVELRGMGADEAAAFIAQRLRALRMDAAAAAAAVADGAQLAPLIEVTGGNPKAIEMALGSLKYARRPLQDVVDDLRGARGGLFEDLFARNWSLLDEAARRVLLAAAFFAPSASAEALAAAADVRAAAFSRAVETLADLSLLDVLRSDLIQAPRYALHPLVRAFAEAELRADPGFEAAARARWLDWHVRLAAPVGYCRDDLERLKRLDPERDALHGVAAWAQQHGRPADVLALVEGCGFYCYVRGLLGRAPDINLAAAEAARALGDAGRELKWASYHAQRLARRGELDAVARLLPRLHALAAAGPLAPDVAEPYRHAVASYWLASGQRDQAEREWRALLATDGLGEPGRLVAVKWLAECLRQGDRLEEAQAVIEEALRASDERRNARAAVALKLALAKVHLARGDLNAASDLADQCDAAVRANGIERHAPDVTFLEGRLAEARGDADGARVAYAAAAARFRALGLRREADEAQAALSQIDA